MVKSSIYRALVALLLACWTLSSCSGESPRIYGNITGLPDTGIHLNVYEKGVREIDNTISREGRFSFVMPEILPDMLLLGFEENPGFYLPIIAEGSDIYISGNFNYHEDIKVSGSVSNDALWKYHNSVKSYDIMLRTIEMGIKEYSDSTDLSKLTHKRDSIRTLLNSAQRNFIIENPQSIVSAMFSLNMLADSSNHRQIQSLISSLDTTTMVDNAFLRRLYRRRDSSERRK